MKNVLTDLVTTWFGWFIILFSLTFIGGAIYSPIGGVMLIITIVYTVIWFVYLAIKALKQ